MTRKNKNVRFAEFRQLLEGLGYRLASTDAGAVFQHAKERPILLRRYRDNEKVDPGDLLYARRFLDLHGLLGEAEFDTCLHRTSTPA